MLFPAVERELVDSITQGRGTPPPFGGGYNKIEWMNLDGMLAVPCKPQVLTVYVTAE
jgi:hypothetical protein